MPHNECPNRISLAATRQLHDELAQIAAGDANRIRSAFAAGNRALRRQDKSFNGQKDLPVALSALVLGPRDHQTLRRFATTLHEIVERAMNWLWADPDRLARHCPDQRRMFPYLRRTRGTQAWQGYSRYDVVVDAKGHLHVIELNTGCPAGFMHAEAFTHATMEAIASLDTQLLPTVARCGTIDRSALVSGLLDAESRAGVQPELVGLLMDENNLTHELDLLCEEFSRRERTAAILDARELVFEDGRLTWRGAALSLVYQKFRISVPTSANHCWRDGFEQRYAGLLAATRADAAVAVNNLAALCISEDKSLLALLAEPEVLAELTPAQRKFVEEHVLWTTRLGEKQVEWDSQRVDLLPWARRHAAQLVIKPCHEGRGFGVFLGCETPPQAWQELCRIDPRTPRVIQRYVEPVTLPVVSETDGRFIVRPMYLTLGLGVVNGRYCGVLSRISPNRVTNVAREGMVQAVLQTSDAALRQPQLSV
jgi:hypothetical protein